MTRIGLILAGFTFALVAVGCSVDAQNAEETGEAAQDELRSTSLVGTYDVGMGTAAISSYRRISLASNHTFSATLAASGAAVSGKWSVAKNAVTFTEANGAAEKFIYTLSGISLKLRRSPNGAFSFFSRRNAHYPKVGIGEVCSDALGNIIAQCPENFGCEFSGDDLPSAKLQHCWPGR